MRFFDPEDPSKTAAEGAPKPKLRFLDFGTLPGPKELGDIMRRDSPLPSVAGGSGRLDLATEFRTGPVTATPSASGGTPGGGTPVPSGVSGGLTPITFTPPTAIDPRVNIGPRLTFGLQPDGSFGLGYGF